MSGKRNCGGCALYACERTPTGRPKNQAAPCRAPVPERPAVTACYALVWPPHRCQVWPQDGADCPDYAPRGAPV